VPPGAGPTDGGPHGPSGQAGGGGEDEAIDAEFEVK
jgi:hypothetical protein